MTPRTRPSLLPNLLLSLGSVVLFLGAAEGVSRMVERAQPPRPRAPYITDWAAWDGDFYTVKSTAVGWPPWEDYNRDGLRDREHALAKPTGVRRVVSLGDSTTLGWGLRPEEAYPQVLQDRASALGRNLEVFNVGLGGWSTRQELIAYRRLARPYQPDLVLLGICLNDFAEMQNNLARPPAWLGALHLRFALVRRIVRAEDREIGSIEELFGQPPSPRVEDGFRRVFEDVRTLRDEVKADGAELVVLLLPYRQQVEAGAVPAVPQRRMAEFCAKEKIRFLDLLPVLRGSGESGFIDPVHLSAAGARRVADAVLQVGLPLGEAGEVSESLASGRNGPGTDNGKKPPPAATSPQLVQKLASSRSEDRAAAARALGTLGPEGTTALEALTAALEDPVADVRVAAAWAIGGLGPSAAGAVTALGKCTRDQSAQARAGAAWALGRIGPSAQSAAPSLVERLRDADETVRWRAGDALGAVGCNVTVVAPLVEILSDAHASGRAQAAEALGRCGVAAAPALAALALALGDEREEVRWRAAWALGEIGPGAQAAVAPLVAAMADEAIRWRVADALGGIGPGAAEAVPVLTEAVRDSSSNVRWRAVKALGRIGPAARSATTALLAALEDAQDNVRAAAALALPKVEPPSQTVLPAYLRALKDPDSRVRHHAADALGRLGPAARDAGPSLVLALGDDDAVVRGVAARALGRIGPAAPGAASRALTQALKDPDAGVRAEAEKALRQVKAPRL